MSVTVERKYAMTRVGTGDYLLPSNDAATTWRIQRYEDGPSYGLEDWPRDRVLWRILRWVGNGRADTSADGDDRWREVAYGFSKRGEAINRALNWKPATASKPRPKKGQR